ncbi:Right handed beta helix region [Halogranum rubrum]|uniref:Right handed beta helix region n=1 Tax=Halogranum rubrum TaxID=553466 RepID=A0A1I4II15_9EURY|nr:right-handed parallel beta-helix repeat-containing protein [Halogranum rubrum]SFL54012.1 Right handed beta helix region [Halogranum rubrum]
MPETPRQFSRRSILGTVGAAAVGTAAFSGQAAAQPSKYETINIVDAGADNTGSESISSVLEDVIGDRRRIYFPPGEYYVDEGVRFTDFDRLWLFGDDATIVPAPADEFAGEDHIFKLGTHYAPGDWLHIGDLTFDFRADNTGLRAIQAQVNDCYIHDIDFVGQHDAGTHGPMLVDVVDEDSIAAVDRVRMPDGGAWTKNTGRDGDPVVEWGPTGFIVSPHHEGTLWVRDCVVGGFPDNGLYDSGAGGTVVVRGGRFENSGTASIRLDGDGSVVDGATIVVDEPQNGVAQQGIRLDGGSGCVVNDTEIVLERPTANAITVRNAVDSAKISDTTVRVLDDGVDGAITVAEGAGSTLIEDTTVELDASGQAIEIEPGNGDVVVADCTVIGNGSGASGGREAIVCARDDTVFRSNVVEQPGDDYRRALGIRADNVTVSGGRYEATHHPIIVDGDGVTITDVTAESYDGYEAVKIVSGSGTRLVDNALAGGYTR